MYWTQKGTIQVEDGDEGRSDARRQHPRPRHHRRSGGRPSYGARPIFAQVEKAFAQVQATLPELVRKRYEDVERFHESIVQNRESHLRGEIDAARARIAEREREARQLDLRRSELMRVLEAGGALEQYTELQSELARLDGRVSILRTQYDHASRLESQSLDLDIEKKQLLKRLRDDHADQRALIEDAILGFEAISRRLYEAAGQLVVNAGDKGPEFEIQKEGKRGAAVGQMQIYCFDLMLAELWASRKKGPGVLIHDSHIFDGVDGRQIASALTVGAEKAQEHGFQYIVTLNEDDLNRAERESGLSFASHVLPVRLLDTEDGGLFGFRFG